MKKRIMKLSASSIRGRITKYIDDCKQTFAPLPDNEETELDIQVKEARKETMLRTLDPRYNYFAPMAPPLNEIKNMSKSELRRFKYRYVKEEYKNSWHAMLSPASYAKHHAKVVEEYIKQLPPEEVQDTEDWENFYEFQKFLRVNIEEATTKEQLQLGKEAMESGFIQFLKGYAEGKKEEERKGPLKPENLRF